MSETAMEPSAVVREDSGRIKGHERKGGEVAMEPRKKPLSDPLCRIVEPVSIKFQSR